MKTLIIAMLAIGSSLFGNISSPKTSEIKPGMNYTYQSFYDTCKDLIVYSVPQGEKEDTENLIKAECCKKLFAFGKRFTGRQAEEFND